MAIKQLGVLALATVVSACGGDTPPPPPPNPPQVFITAAQTALAENRLPLTVNITGCQKVVGFELWHDKTRIVSLMPSSYPANVELTGADLQPLYGTLGIAPTCRSSRAASATTGARTTPCPWGCASCRWSALSDLQRSSRAP